MSLHVPQAVLCRILLVDDSPHSRSVLRKDLVAAGFDDINEAANGYDALDLLETSHFDLLITDWYMPGLHGVELLRRVRQDPQLRTLPVIMVGSAYRDELVAVAKAFGVSAHLTKPFSPGELGRLVESMLRAR